MNNTKPFVSAACICEKVLQEKDGVPSLIRVVDTFHVRRAPKDIPEDVLVAAATEYTLAVSLKSGSVEGKHSLGIRLTSPSGQVKDVYETPVVLQGGIHGLNLFARIAIGSGELGTSWFDVLWDGEPLTRVPFRLIEQDSAKQEQSSS